MKVGDLVMTVCNGDVGLVLGRGEKGEVHVEFSRSFSGRTMWTFYEDELEMLNESR